MATSTAKLNQLSRSGATGSVVVAWLEKAHLTVAGTSAIGLAVFGWIIARLLGSRTLYLLVYAGVLVMVISWLVARKRLSLEVDRSDLPARMREGQSADVVLKLRAEKRATVLIVEEHLDPALGRTV